MRFIFILMVVSCLVHPVAGQVDSIKIKVYPNPASPYDTSYFYKQPVSSTDIQSIFDGTETPSNGFVGFNFSFGALTEPEIKSLYPGYIGFGVQAGIKSVLGILAEGGYGFHQYNANVFYVAKNQTIINSGPDTVTTTTTINDANLTGQKIHLSIYYTDYKSPFTVFRYIYVGLDIGMTNIRESGVQTTTTTSSVNGSSIPVRSRENFSKWIPTISFITGINFLYLPESKNWLAFDFRVSLTPGEGSKGSNLQVERSNHYNGFQGTMRFYFDITQL